MKALIKYFIEVYRVHKAETVLNQYNHVVELIELHNQLNK